MPGIRTARAGLPGLAMAVAACQPLAPAGGPEAAQAQPGRVFAQVQCSACHAVDRRNVSPDPGAPPFAAIVNREGVTGNTLAVWLRDAHNYPDEMRFTLDGRTADELVEYMLTLRDPNYRPAI